MHPDKQKSELIMSVCDYKNSEPQFGKMRMNSHHGPAEVGRGFVPAGAAWHILTHIDVVHQPVTIEEAFP